MTLDDAGNVTGFPQFEEAERRIEYIYKTKQRLQAIPPKRIREGDERPVTEIGEFPQQLQAVLDDDLNMPIALAKLADFLKAVNELCDKAAQKKGVAAKRAVDAALAGFDALGSELGLGAQASGTLLTRIRDRRAARMGITREDVEQRIADRTAARAAKNFDEADRIRGELADLGVELLDGPQGTDWTIVEL